MSNGNKQIIKVTKFVENLLVTQVISTLTCTSLERNWSQPWEDKSNLVHTAAHKKKKVHKLVGQSAALQRLISILVKRCYISLKHSRWWELNDKKMMWIELCQLDFYSLIQYMFAPLILSKANLGEPPKLVLCKPDFYSRIQYIFAPAILTKADRENQLSEFWKKIQTNPKLVQKPPCKSDTALLTFAKSTIGEGI